MQAAEDAARFQAVLGLEHINVVGGAQAQGSAGSIVVVLDSKTNVILNGEVQMCIVPVEEAPAYILAALERCSRSKVIVWEKPSACFHDLAKRTLCRLLTKRDLKEFCVFWLKLHNNVQSTTTLQGTWCALRIGEASVETSCYTNICGTVVLSNAVEHVLTEMLRTLAAEASPLVDAGLPVRRRKRLRITEETAGGELVSVL